MHACEIDNYNKCKDAGYETKNFLMFVNLSIFPSNSN